MGGESLGMRLEETILHGGDNKGMCVEPNETMRGWVWRERQNVVMSIRSNTEVNKGMGVERGTKCCCNH